MAATPPKLPRIISTTELPAAPAAREGEDSLFQLQLRVARRADEVARSTREPNKPSLLAWIQAEREVLARLEM